MALVPMASKGNFVHVYDFRVKPGTGDEFIRLFDEFDYSDANVMHTSSAQVKDGVLCRDVKDPDHFYLLGEWADIDVHAQLRKTLASTTRLSYMSLVEGGRLTPTYAAVVSSTPQHILDRASGSPSPR